MPLDVTNRQMTMEHLMGNESVTDIGVCSEPGIKTSYLIEGEGRKISVSTGPGLSETSWYEG